jgi:hypothetical protein
VVTREAAPEQVCPGPLLFARYAYPPNALGFCGPPDSAALLQYSAAGVVDAGLGLLARGFAGAWPYLQLIAGALRIPDPLDRRVVEAYWIGNPLLDRIDVGLIGGSLEDRFRHRVGSDFGDLVAGAVAGGVPHHSFHVLCVYPWVGLLGDDRKSRHALDVLDKCRIRWGRVTALDGEQVAVRCQALEWDGRRLALGEAHEQWATRSTDGLGTAGDLRPGDWVALHWDWVCDRLSRRQLRHLRHYTALHLDVANDRLERPGVAVALGR